MILQMDIGGSVPRMYTLKTMKHTGGTWYVRSIRRYIISYVPVTRYQVVYMLCDFIPDHHRGGPEIANKTAMTIGTTVRATRPSSSTGRPCCGRAVRFLGFVIRAYILSGMAVTSRSTKTITLRVTTGNGPLETLFVITSIINYHGILQLFPRG